MNRRVRCRNDFANFDRANLNLIDIGFSIAWKKINDPTFDFVYLQVEQTSTHFWIGMQSFLVLFMKTMEIIYF